MSGDEEHVPVLLDEKHNVIRSYLIYPYNYLETQRGRQSLVCLHKMLLFN